MIVEVDVFTANFTLCAFSPERNHAITIGQKIIGHPYSFVCGYEAGYLGSIFSINFSRFITNAWKWLLDASIRDLNCGMIILIDSLKIVCCMCVVCLLFFVLWFFKIAKINFSLLRVVGGNIRNDRRAFYFCVLVFSSGEFYNRIIDRCR